MMQPSINRHHRIALHAERAALQAALSTEQQRLSLARAASLRAKAELERACWEDEVHAPVDRARFAREALRAAQARRARLRDEIAACDDLIDQDDIAA